MMLIAGLISIPVRVRFSHDAIIVSVKKFWWRGKKSGVRAMTLGNTILLGPAIELNDERHELVHVAQHMRTPFFQPFLALIEQLQHGYHDSKYEVEAYSKTGSKYYE